MEPVSGFDTALVRIASATVPKSWPSSNPTWSRNASRALGTAAAVIHSKISNSGASDSSAKKASAADWATSSASLKRCTSAASAANTGRTRATANDSAETPR